MKYNRKRRQAKLATKEHAKIFLYKKNNNLTESNLYFCNCNQKFSFDDELEDCLRSEAPTETEQYESDLLSTCIHYDTCFIGWYLRYLNIWKFLLRPDVESITEVEQNDCSQIELTTTETTTTYDSTTTPSPFDCHRKPDGHYKHPTDCRSFVNCHNGAASVENCPSDLTYFDDVTGTCTEYYNLPEERKIECGLKYD